MSIDIRLRRALARDRGFLYELHVATMRNYVELTWGWEESAQRRMFDERFVPERIEVIELDSQPIGMMIVTEGDDSIELRSIEILPDHQRRGYGSIVLGELLARARGSRKVVNLQVLRVNPARQLYARLGFVLAAENDTHYTMTWRGDS